MKAVTCRRYGPPEVLQLEEVAKPAPGPREILIRNRATSVSTGDWRLRKPDPFAVRFFFGFRGPRVPILGLIFAGEVEETGRDVKRFQKGDLVFGSTGMRCGAYAEYVCVSENAVIAEKPATMDFEEAACVPFGALTALHFLQRARIVNGQKVLVYGASGSVGSAAVQLAKVLDAEVTGVCSEANLDLVRSLGASHVIDYTKEDLEKHKEKYDVVFEAVGKLPMSVCEKLLTPRGCALLASAGPGAMFKGLWISLTSRRRVISGVTSETRENLLVLKKLIEEGKFKAVIDRRYSLEEIAQAHLYAESGHKKGNLAVRIP